MTKDEALKLALEALEFMSHVDSIFANEFDFQINAIKEALAQPERLAELGWQEIDCPICGGGARAFPKPEQEPMAWIERDMQCDDFDPDSVTCEKPTIAADGWEWVALYTTPPQRKPLTDEEKLMCWARATCDADVEHKTEHQCLMDYADEIEAAHGIKENT